MDACVFCKIVKHEVPAIIVDENETVISFLTFENHPLVVPKKHIKDIYELDEETGKAIMAETIKVAKALKKSINPDGINLVQANEHAAHQDVFHFHMHIKPRWKGDKVQMDWEVTRVPDEVRVKTQQIIRQAL